MRALCVGSAMLDTIVIVANRDVERMTMHNDASSFLLLKQGVKVEAASISEHIGGGAVNAAVAMARLGVRTGALIKLGTDHDGDKILARLEAEDVETGDVRRTGEDATGAAVMVSSHDRDATIFTRRGANTLLAEDDLSPDSFSGRDLVYVTNLSNESADRFPDIVRLAADAGAFVAANPGIRQLTSRGGAFLECLSTIDLLAINRVEAEALIPTLVGAGLGRGASVPVWHGDDVPRLLQIGLDFGGHEMLFPDFCSIVRDLGPNHVVVTDGARGAYLADEGGIHHVPVIEGPVLGTAGAGDAFNATCAAYIARGSTVAEALRAAAVNAASVVTRVDTQSGLLSRDALDTAVRRIAAELPIDSFT